jgi:hypothetical protein
MASELISSGRHHKLKRHNHFGRFGSALGLIGSSLEAVHIPSRTLLNFTPTRPTVGLASSFDRLRGTYVLTRILIFLGLLLGGASMLHAQAEPTASRVGDLQIGGGYSSAASDYSLSRFNGGSAYVDFDFTHRLGVEGKFAFVKAGGTSDIYEKTYEIGGRYHRTYGKWAPYARIMYGRGVFNYPDNAANLAYNMFAAGAGVDYKIRPYLNVRGDFEYQDWTGFPPTGLTPSMFTIGAAYHFR